MPGLLWWNQRELDHACFDEILHAADRKGRVEAWFWFTPVLYLHHWNDVKRICLSTLDEHDSDNNPVASKPCGRTHGQTTLTWLNAWKTEQPTLKESLSSARSITAQVTQTLVSTLQQRIQQRQSSSCTDPSYIIANVLELTNLIAMDLFGLMEFSYPFHGCQDLQKSDVAVAFACLIQEWMRRSAERLPGNVGCGAWPDAAHRRDARERRVVRQFLMDRLTEHSYNTNSHCHNNTNNVLTHCQSEHEESPRKSGDQWEGITVDDSYLDHTLGILFSRYETLSITLTYVFYVMSQAPFIHEECIKEIQSLQTRNRKNNNNNDLVPNVDQLVYCRAVLQETLRLNPPVVTMTRRVHKRHSITLEDGFVIPAHQIVNFPIWSIHRCEYNFPRPQEFLPERWVRKSLPTTEEDKDDSYSEWIPRNYPDDDNNNNNNESHDIPAGNPEALFPFSSGADQDMASLQQALIVMAHVLPVFQFATLPGYALTPEIYGVSQRPRGGLPMAISLRE